jgi:phosphohistidine phosphatase
MKRLYVLRHAKSSWGEPALRDHDRPLAPRGKRAAKAMARHLRDERIEPELVLCSTARRARETLLRIEPALGRRSVQVEDALYGASAGALLERLQAVPDAIASVMVIGHNPGLEDLVVLLTEPSPARSEVQAKFPTAALASLAFDVERWRDLRAGGGDLVAFVRPRDLKR